MCCTWVEENPGVKTGWRVNGLRGALPRRTWGFWWMRLDKTQQCAPVAQKVKCILGCIRSSVASRVMKGILPLCSVLVRPLECCIQLWGSQHRRDIDLLEGVQRMDHSAKGTSLYETRLSQGCSA